MFNYSKIELAKKATELKFNRDTLERMYRLIDVLLFLNKNPKTRDLIALKGGTAINLTIFNLPRLSVDIDLDLCSDVNRQQMFIIREQITDDIKRFMRINNYILSIKSRFHHSLDSLIFEYMNLGGSKDNIKIEINYSLRTHIYPLETRKIVPDELFHSINILCINRIELIASKLVALINRKTARDLYDISNFIKVKYIENHELEKLRKAVIFYYVISSNGGLDTITNETFESITLHKIKTDLLPVIKLGESIDLDGIKEMVKSFINQLMIPNDDEIAFINYFHQGIYKPELLFYDNEILKRIVNHPMAIWRIGKITDELR